MIWMMKTSGIGICCRCWNLTSLKMKMNAALKFLLKMWTTKLGMTVPWWLWSIKNDTCVIFSTQGKLGCLLSWKLTFQFDRNFHTVYINKFILGAFLIIDSLKPYLHLHIRGHLPLYFVKQPFLEQKVTTDSYVPYPGKRCHWTRSIRTTGQLYSVPWYTPSLDSLKSDYGTAAFRWLNSGYGTATSCGLLAW